MAIMQERLSQAENLVKEFSSLRKLQKRYFQTRRYDDLRQAKAQESKVDSLIVKWNNKQPLLGQNW